MQNQPSNFDVLDETSVESMFLIETPNREPVALSDQDKLDALLFMKQLASFTRSYAQGISEEILSIIKWENIESPYYEYFGHMLSHMNKCFEDFSIEMVTVRKVNATVEVKFKAVDLQIDYGFTLKFKNDMNTNTQLLTFFLTRASSGKKLCSLSTTKEPNGSCTVQLNRSGTENNFKKLVIDKGSEREQSFGRRILKLSEFVTIVIGEVAN